MSAASLDLAAKREEIKRKRLERAAGTGAAAAQPPLHTQPPPSPAAAAAASSSNARLQTPSSAAASIVSRDTQDPSPRSKLPRREGDASVPPPRPSPQAHPSRAAFFASSSAAASSAAAAPVPSAATLHTPDYVPALSIPANVTDVPVHWRPISIGESIRNDLSAKFVATGERPQNFLREAAEDDEGSDDEKEEPAAAPSSRTARNAQEHLPVDVRHGGDPQLVKFGKLKQQMIDEWKATQPYMAHRVDLRDCIPSAADGRVRQDLVHLLGGYEYDVIVIDPPWREYEKREGAAQQVSSNGVDPAALRSWSFEELRALPIQQLAAEPALLFLWCGTGEHLAEASALMAHWGFHNHDDVCWIQTNRTSKNRSSSSVKRDATAIFQRTWEHCLMGIRGERFVLRDSDLQSMSRDQIMQAGMVQFVHPGSSCDVIVGEQPPGGSTAKPTELYDLIERYCVGRRRLELFGSEHNLRHGWLTLGLDIPSVIDNLDIGRFMAQFEVVPIREGRTLEDGTVIPPEFITKAKPTQAAQAAQRARDEYDRIHGRLDARVGHYLPHTVELERVRPQSPPHKSAHRKGIVQGTRRIWNDGMTAGMRALQDQLNDEAHKGGAAPAQHASLNTHNAAEPFSASTPGFGAPPPTLFSQLPPMAASRVPPFAAAAASSAVPPWAHRLPPPPMQPPHMQAQVLHERQRSLSPPPQFDPSDW